MLMSFVFNEINKNKYNKWNLPGGINKYSNCEKYGMKDVNFNNIDKPENWFHDFNAMLLPDIILFSLVISLFIISDLLYLDDRKSKKLKRNTRIN